MNYNEDKIIGAVASINDISLEDLNDAEAFLSLCNSLLAYSEKHLPKELDKDSTTILSNGKQIAYELLKHEDSIGLNVAYHVHRIIAIVNKGLIDD